MAVATRVVIGWREWVALPGLSLPAIKIKADTGARTSALHAFYVERFRQRRNDYVRFGIHPLQRRNDVAVTCMAPLIDQRQVSDSGGHRELRYVIITPVRMGDHEWPIEITLTNRDTMLFRMLLGRSAMQGSVLVDPGASYRLGRPPVRRLYHLRAKQKKATIRTARKGR